MDRYRAVFPLAGRGGLYPYTEDLLTLDLCRNRESRPCTSLGRVHTPLNTQAWELALAPHPDRAFARYLLRGINEGFRIGFDRACPLQSTHCNMLSARQYPDVVQAYLDKERSAGRMLGPFTPDDLRNLPRLQVNRFGVIPKGHNTGKWRLITDLSHPPGQSVNDGIDTELCSLSYISVDLLATVAADYPPGTLMAKIDIESAYRLIPVHPSDRPLQAMEFEECVYVDPMLPFGLRSAPKIFNALADGLEWHLRNCGIRHVFQYLDDFIVVAPPHSSECAEALAIITQACANLGVPLAEHKRDGPTTCLTFLGIEVDTVASQLRLPLDKLHRLRVLLEDWRDKKVCERRELESLVGLLHHACKVVRSGRSFLRRMIDLLKGVRHHLLRPHPIRLNKSFRSDLTWWSSFVTKWNGISFLPPPSDRPRLQMTSDASGSWGCGAWHLSHWFQLQWDANAATLSIMVKEMLPVVLACAVWGPAWRTHCVTALCDNQAVVACLRSRTSHDSHIMHMLRTLAFVEATYDFSLSPLYISTGDNHLADDLSRDKLLSFLSKVPHADTQATPLPPQLVELFLDPSVDWTSQRWLRLFNDTFKTVSPRPLARLMSRQ